jgi:signal peptidase I
MTNVRAIRTIVWACCVVAALGAWAVLLRPASMGGSAGYVMIRGASMLPTYVTGDLVITRRAASYANGDIVAYKVPAGEFGEGIVVIHRIIGGSAEEGFVIQGDNNEFRDDWKPKSKDIVGVAWLRLPRVGLILGFLHAPVPLACLAAATTIVFVLFPENKKRHAPEPEMVAAPAVPAVPPAIRPLPSVLAVVPCVVHDRRWTARVIELPQRDLTRRAA